MFPFSTPVAIDTTKNYYLCIWQAFPPDMIYTSIKVGDYLAPVKISVSNIVEITSTVTFRVLDTTVPITVRDVVIAADRPINLTKFLSVTDQVEAAELEKPTTVSPCFGRYIDLETMLGLPKSG